MHTHRSSDPSRHPSASGRSTRRRPAAEPARRQHPQAGPPVGGRHELGQNFLVDRRVIDRVVELVDATRGPIVELGAGGGALTRPLASLGRPLTALELDPHRADALRRELSAGVDGEARSDQRMPRAGHRPRRRAGHREHAPPERAGTPRRVRVVTADALAWRFPADRYVIASNVPFHLTTAILRRILAEPAWTDAVLLTQWEVARRRCGVGGTSQLTVQWAPWFEFELDRRVPARAFRPAPSVDGGLFTIRRRTDPLVPDRERRAYQEYVGAVFAGRGRGLAQVLARTSRPLPNPKRWLAHRGIPADALPPHLAPTDWAGLWHAVRSRT